MRRLAFVLLLSFGFVAIGCDKMPWSSSDSKSEKSDKKKKKKGGKDDDDDEKSSKSDDDDEGGGGGDIPDSCKKYKKKYGPCVLDKTPASAKKQTKEAWEKAMESWAENAKTKAGRKALDDSCKQLLEALPEDCDK